LSRGNGKGKGPTRFVRDASDGHVRRSASLLSSSKRHRRSPMSSGAAEDCQTRRISKIVVSSINPKRVFYSHSNFRKNFFSSAAGLTTQGIFLASLTSNSCVALGTKASKSLLFWSGRFGFMRSRVSISSLLKVLD
jgi:hypothetical protein